MTDTRTIEEIESHVKQVWPQARLLQAMVTDDDNCEGWAYWVDGIPFRMRGQFGSKKQAWLEAEKRIQRVTPPKPLESPAVPPPSPQPPEINPIQLYHEQASVYPKPAAPLDSLSDATPQADTVAARSWHKVHGRPDVLGVRTLVTGQREYLMHNEALSQPYYVVIEEKRK